MSTQFTSSVVEHVQCVDMHSSKPTASPESQNSCSYMTQNANMNRLTALRKPNGGVRGVATGDVFRRAFSGELDSATRPFQFALQTRAGTDSLAAMLRAAVELQAT